MQAPAFSPAPARAITPARAVQTSFWARLAARYIAWADASHRALRASGARG